jgi:hypothetical protein
MALLIMGTSLFLLRLAVAAAAARRVIASLRVNTRPLNRITTLTLVNFHTCLSHTVGYPDTRRTIAPRTERNLVDIAAIRLCLPDSVMPAAKHHHRRNTLHLTGNDVAISRIESKLLEPLSVNVKKGATGRQRTWRPVARPGFGGGGGGNRTRIYITDSKKNSLAGFAAIERILR